MAIKVSKVIGFCDGVNRAIELCKNSRRNASIGQTIFTLGEVIHNRDTVSELYDLGIKAVEIPSEIPRGSTTVICAHGVAESVINQLKKQDVKIIDATCPVVKKIHSKVKEFSRKNFHIMIIGDKNHKEVIATSGYAKSHSVICENSLNANEILFNTISEHKDFFVVSQTTISTEKYEVIKEKIVEIAKNLSKTVVFFDSICYTTRVRQNEAEKIAKWADTMFVLGDSHSSNTTKLFDLSQKYCKNVFLISNVSDLQSAQYKVSFVDKLGIISGASAPKRLIMEVCNLMNVDNQTDIMNNEGVVPTDSQATAEVVAEKETKTAKSTEITTMAEAMKKYGGKSYREGMKLKAKIVSVDPTGISVAVEGAGKNDSGFIDKDEVELEAQYNADNYHIDDLLNVVVIPKPNGLKLNGLYLSKKAYDAFKIDDEKVKKILEGDEFTLSCTQEINGGLLGKIGSYAVFVPASQIRIGYVKNLADYIGKPLRLKALPPKEEVDAEGNAVENKRKNNKRIVASQRIILENEKLKREEEFWGTMQVNNIVIGKVKRFSDFGAFVSVKNFDCLAHISDLSWNKIANPAEVLEISKSYDFVILKVDRESNKISLGYKQLLKKPYEIAADKYPVGTIITGKVCRIHPFGAFVEIEPGIDGLVHVSQIANKYVKNAGDVLNVGDEVEAKIIGFEDNKITLSIKELLPEVAETADEQHEERKYDRQPKKRKDRADDEPREWVSNSNGATFADLFKDFNMDDFDNK